jgi:4-hydroxy-tetrahydrodipicolinate synthase
MALFQGTGTALVTPYNSDGTIDFPALGALVDFQIAGGVEFLVSCGSTGESATMTAEEDAEVIRFVVERAAERSAGRVPVVAGTGSNNTNEAVRYTRNAKKLGAAGALVVNPYYNKPPHAGIVRHYQEVCSAADIPVIIYNVPGRTGSNMSAETQLAVMEACAGDGTGTGVGVVATKEASGSLDQMMEILRHKPAHCAVLSGDDALALPLVAVGGAGVISVLSNYAPRMFSDCVRAALAGDFHTARELHVKLFDVMKLNFIEPNPIPVKAALHLMGMIQNKLRLPLVPIADENKTKLAVAMRSAGLL